MAGTNTRSVIQFVVLLGVGILLIWLSLRSVAPEKDKIFNAFASANYGWIWACMGISFLSHFLRAYRWNYLLNPLGYKVGIFNSTCHVLVGYFANYGIPRMGEITRCSLAFRYDKVPVEVGFGTVITERIIDFLLFLIIFMLTLAFQFNELIDLANEYVFDKIRAKMAGASVVSLSVIGAIVVLFILFFIKFRKKIANALRGKLGNLLKGMGEGIGSITKMKKPVQFIALSLLIWACYFYSLYVCFFALSGTSHLGQKECLTLLLFGTFGVMFSPGGLGAYPVILAGILTATFGVDSVSAFALPWLSWTSQFVLVVVMGILSLIMLPIFNKNKDVVSSAVKS